MVAKMMRWRPWPPLVTKRYDVKVRVKNLEGCDWVREGPEKVQEVEASSLMAAAEKLAVEIRWKGPKIALSSLRRSVRRNFTREEGVGSNGVVAWEDEFQSVCNLSSYKDNAFHPWEISFTLLNGLKQGARSKVLAIGVASVNLAEFAPKVEEKEFDVKLPFLVSFNGTEYSPSLTISLSLSELRTSQEAAESGPRSIMPIASPPQSGECITTEKDELSAIKAGLKKVKIFTEYVSTSRAKKACREADDSQGRCSVRSEDGDYSSSPFESDSLDDFEEGESDNVKEDSSIRKSFSYGTLAYANYAGGSLYSSARISGKDEDWVYYSNRKSDEGSCIEDVNLPASEPPLLQGSKRSILPWRKRKLSFRSPKAKGEPLLKKAYGEEGGDDIDFDRRQLSSDESLPFGLQRRNDEDSFATRSSVSEFGDDHFAVGSWEQKEIISRDGYMKVQTQVFFASIDQRSEQAAGESACTALVAVIVEWFQSNRDVFPNKSQFDSLIREGSAEWRKLCEKETYRERFPDKHFDLETVLQAKIRPLSVVPFKSFIGFFRPEGMDEGRFEFLHGAMSFDTIWDEISFSVSNSSCSSLPQVYIVSWNDHFFVLKVEADAYYVIDTLGERLYEGCNQAYILKFDKDTIIQRVTSFDQSGVKKSYVNQQAATAVGSKIPQGSDSNLKEEVSMAGEVVAQLKESMNNDAEGEIVCHGKESCKEYLKSFLAAIPIRELQTDLKKGLMSSTPLHHRLQIEFHYAELLEPSSGVLAIEEFSSSQQNIEVAITDTAS